MTTRLMGLAVAVAVAACSSQQTETSDARVNQPRADAAQQDSGVQGGEGGAGGRSAGPTGGTAGGKGAGGTGQPGTGGKGSAGTGQAGGGGTTPSGSGGGAGTAGATGSGGAAGSGGGADGSGSLFVVSGPQILKNGIPFIVKGVNIPGYRDDWPGDSTDAAMVHALIDCWRFNTVRVRNYPLGAVHYQNNNSLDYLDRIVSTYTSKGLVVLLDAHDRTGGFYSGSDLDQLVAWHKMLATKYASNPLVWLDISNEPGENSNEPPDVASWTTMFQAVIAGVRGDVQANNILFVEATSWGQDAANWNSDDVDSDYSILLSTNTAKVVTFGGHTFGNIVFSLHVYDQWQYGDTRMSDYFSALLKKNLPVVVGEWGTWNNVNVPEAMRSFGRVVLPKNDVGRIVWAWGGLDGDTLTTEGSCGAINDCTAPSNLTELGGLVWSDTHR